MVTSSGYPKDRFVFVEGLVEDTLPAHRPPPERRYDVVVLAEVVEHLYTSLSIVLSWVAGWLRPPGFVVIKTPNGAALHKRLRLLVSDREGALGLLRGEPPVQIVLAGKAHPRDEEAKAMLAELFELKSAPEVARRVVFLDDYDLSSAALVRRAALCQDVVSA